MKNSIFVVCVAALALSVGCGSDDDPDLSSNNQNNSGNSNNQTNNNANNQTTNSNNQTTGSEGENVYRTRQASGNVFACATCHALDNADDVPKRPGHPIGGAPARDSYKNGQLDTFLEAANTCLDEWMSADQWTETSPDFVALTEFLSTHPDSEEISFTIVDPPTDLAGNGENGELLFNASCAGCHGEGGGGTILAPVITGQSLSPEYIAGRIRLSGSTNSPIYENLTGGRMPFWSQERLSDADLRDITMFVAESDPVNPNNANNENNNNGTNNTNNTNNGNARTCESTHPRVGQSLELTERFHDVGGTVTIVDDCTIEITNFTFDGTGIDVQLYTGTGTAPNIDYNDGASLSGDLRRAQPYDGETLRIQLPGEETLNDIGNFDGLSIWCVPVGASFGDGAF